MIIYRSQAGDAIAAAAETQLGVPYVFGGDTWNEDLDCSGLTEDSALYGAKLILPRTSEEQADVAGTRLALDTVKLRGDFVFFVGAPVDPPPGHVGVYEGVGVIEGTLQHAWKADPHGRAVMINAPYTGDLGGVRFDYCDEVGSIIALTRPALLAPVQPTQRLVKGMTWTPAVPTTKGDWLVYGAKKAGMPGPANLAAVKAAGVPEKVMDHAELAKLQSVSWGAL